MSLDTEQTGNLSYSVIFCHIVWSKHLILSWYYLRTCDMRRARLFCAHHCKLLSHPWLAGPPQIPEPVGTTQDDSLQTWSPDAHRIHSWYTAVGLEQWKQEQSRIVLTHLWVCAWVPSSVQWEHMSAKKRSIEPMWYNLYTLGKSGGNRWAI